MKTLKIALVSCLVVSLSAPAFAGPQAVGPTGASGAATPAVTDVGPTFRSGAGATAPLATAQQTAPSPQRGSIPKGYLWPGTILFVGGMAMAFDGFLNNKNGKFPEFGEATATDKKLGAAGLVTAFAGGTLLFLGTKARSAPSITFGKTYVESGFSRTYAAVTVSKQVSW